MSGFYTFLRLGFEHISDLKGYDHILFVTALAAVYPLRAWKQLGLAGYGFYRRAQPNAGAGDFTPD
jgi:hypothetical protein